MKKNIFIACICIWAQLGIYAQQNIFIIDDASFITTVLQTNYNELENEKDRLKKVNDDLVASVKILRNYYINPTTGITSTLIYKADPDLLYKDIKTAYPQISSEINLGVIKASIDQEIINITNDLEPDRKEIDLQEKLFSQKGYNENTFEDEYRTIADKRKNLTKREIDVQKFKIDQSLIRVVELRGYFKSSAVNNPYLAEVCDSLIEKFDTHKLVNTNYLSSTISLSSDKSLFALTGSAAFATVVDGFSKFIADRMKQEVAIAFIDNFKMFMQRYKDSDCVKAFRIIFPNTIQSLETFDPEMYASLPMLLKQNAEKDITSLLDNLPKLQALFPASDASTFVFGSLDLFNKLSKCEKPQEFISAMAHNSLVTGLEASSDKKLKNIASSFRLLDFTSTSLLVKQGSSIGYVNPEYFITISKEKNFRTCFLGFMLGQTSAPFNRNVSFYTNNGSFEIKNLLSNLYNHQTQIDGFVGNMIRAANFYQEVLELSTSIIKQKKQGEKVNYADIYQYYMSSIEVIDSSVALTGSIYLNLTGNELDMNKDEYKNFTKMAYTMGDIYKDVNEKRYVQAGLAAFTMLKGFLTDTQLVSTITKYVTFVGNVALAENSDQVRDAIKAIALPPGSYTIKRKNAFTVSLNAYPGMYAGVQFSESGISFNPGFTAPVGIAFNFGSRANKYRTNKKTKLKEFTGLRYSSHSLFVTVVDLGAPVMFRLTNNDTTRNPFGNLDYLNFISPGIYYSWGIARLPLSLNMGVQYYPKYTVPNSDQSNFNAFRIGAALVVDIPIINFKTKPHVTEFKK